MARRYRETGLTGRELMGTWAVLAVVALVAGMVFRAGWEFGKVLMG